MKKLFFLLSFILISLSTYAQYKVGDYYNSNGVEGMVVVVDESGKHGLVISLHDSKADWTCDKSLNFETNAFHEDDGEKNMKAIEAYIAETGKDWNYFPVFSWARSLGDGWYIPAKDELAKIWTNLNGGDLKLNKKSKKWWKAYNKSIKKSGGEDFYIRNASGMGVGQMLCGMISSTESEGGKVWVICPKGNRIGMNALMPPNAPIEIYEIEKNNHSYTKDILSVTYSFRSRAVHKF